jgi:23S rRNA maturation mini-RNase III
MTIVKQEKKNLIRRYLLWCYKTTKEELDRIDRKFTQLEVDKKMLRELEKGISLADENNAYLQKVKGFKEYIAKKEQSAKAEKYTGATNLQIQPQYFYLQKRLGAIEKTIVSLLGSKELQVIKVSYEEEMTRRILESREHS